MSDRGLQSNRGMGDIFFIRGMDGPFFFSPLFLIICSTCLSPFSRSFPTCTTDRKRRQRARGRNEARNFLLIEFVLLDINILDRVGCALIAAVVLLACSSHPNGAPSVLSSSSLVLDRQVLSTYDSSRT